MKQDRGRVYHLARADKANRARMKDLYGSRCAYAYTCSGERAMRGLRDEDLEFSCQFLAEKEAQEMSW